MFSIMLFGIYVKFYYWIDKGYFFYLIYNCDLVVYILYVVIV